VFNGRGGMNTHIFFCGESCFPAVITFSFCQKRHAGLN